MLGAPRLQNKILQRLWLLRWLLLGPTAGIFFNKNSMQIPSLLGFLLMIFWGIKAFASFYQIFSHHQYSWVILEDNVLPFSCWRCLFCTICRGSHRNANRRARELLQHCSQKNTHVHKIIHRTVFHIILKILGQSLPGSWGKDTVRRVHFGGFKTWRP